MQNIKDACITKTIEETTGPMRVDIEVIGDGAKKHLPGQPVVNLAKQKIGKSAKTKAPNLKNKEVENTPTPSNTVSEHQILSNTALFKYIFQSWLAVMERYLELPRT